MLIYLDINIVYIYTRIPNPWEISNLPFLQAEVHPHRKPSRFGRCRSMAGCTCRQSSWCATSTDGGAKFLFSERCGEIEVRIGLEEEEFWVFFCFGIVSGEEEMRWLRCRGFQELVLEDKIWLSYLYFATLNKLLIFPDFSCKSPVRSHIKAHIWNLELSSEILWQPIYGCNMTMGRIKVAPVCRFYLSNQL